MKRAIFFAVAFVAIGILLTANPKPAVAPQGADTGAEPALPQSAAEDPRKAKIGRVDAYFAERNMPLSGYGSEFVEVAERYGIDWRLLPAIAVRESSGGKQACGNNPFGWASCRTDFDSTEEAIEYVGLNLGGENPRTATYYKNKTTREKLWSYNGTVNPKYPDEVLLIMEKIGNGDKPL